MRGAIPGLPSAVPIGERLPAVLQDDEFLARFLRAFDDSLAPVFATLDGLACYVDPRFAPQDFLLWLGDWVGAVVDQSRSLEHQRSTVMGAAALHRRRGTVTGLRDAVEQILDGGTEVLVEDGGGVSWSTTPGKAFPGSATSQVTVIIASAKSSIDKAAVDQLVRSAIPAHLPYELIISPAPSAAGEGAGE